MSVAAGRYVRELAEAGALAELHPSARHVLEVLAHYANRDGIAWPSVATLAGRTGHHAGTVRRARAALATAGIIAADVSAGGDPRDGETTNRYRFPVVDALSTPRASDAGSAEGPRVSCAETPRVMRDEGLLKGDASTSTDGSGARPVAVGEFPFDDDDSAPVPEHVLRQYPALQGRLRYRYGTGGPFDGR